VTDPWETYRTFDDLLVRITNPKEKMGMQQAHISALETKHANLDQRIHEEIQRPMPDITLLSRLKKEKLKVKETIAKL
jgi:hypothetical protein